MSRSDVIFGNTVSAKAVRKAEKNQKKLIRKFGDDRKSEYHLAIADTPAVGDVMGVHSLEHGNVKLDTLPGNPVIIGCIRMGFGHYRISMAMASCAHALGYDPYWFDLFSFSDASSGKIIRYQNSLYSMGSRWSEKYKLFNRFVWEPMNSEGFRKLTYNSSDQKMTELMTAVYQDLPKDTPFIATHVWPAQAAIHAGMTHVVDAIPDNWPMALHLAEGSIHTVQTHSSWLGYRALRGMNQKRILKPMPKEDLVYTGHYIDHELVAGLEEDCAFRMERITKNKKLRFLLTVGGAGAQRELFRGIIEHLLPYAESGKAVLFINTGDHRKVWEELTGEIPKLKKLASEHMDDHKEAAAFAEEARTGNAEGVHAFCNKDIFSAVYMTNLLMRASDVLITKPSELAFYPVPKLMIHRIGGHEAWGAIHTAELGDGTYECDTLPEVNGMLDLLQNERDILAGMCENILTAGKQGIYDGAYKAVRLAAEGRRL